MKEEYASLRGEILKWQEYRFTILSGSTALVAALVAWEVKSPDQHDWALVSALLLLILSCANALVWYCGRGNSMLGAYLSVFHEELPRTPEGKAINAAFWEKGLVSFRNKIGDRRIVNDFFGLFFIVLAFISVFIPLGVAKDDPEQLRNWLPLTVAVVVFCLSSVLVFKTADRKNYVKYWQDIRREQAAAASGARQPNPHPPCMTIIVLRE